jgi:hypothetical protein
VPNEWKTLITQGGRKPNAYNVSEHSNYSRFKIIPDEA